MKLPDNPDFVKGEVLLINKPLQWTSFDVVNKIRYIIHRKLNVRKIKVGHAGTLDPLADGLLILCTGLATKKIEDFMGLDKVYTGVLVLGATTASYDLETPVENVKDISHLTEEQILKAAGKFTGEIAQVPPLYSAVKIDGKRAYRFAREDEKKEIPPRKVTIHEFRITKTGLPEVAFEVHCSKGTYIRSLANDFGNYLQCGAYLKSLTRQKIGDYTLEDALTITDFEKRVLGDG